LHWALPTEQVTFMELLRSAGYWTAAAGKWHLGKEAKSKLDTVNEGKADRWLPAFHQRPEGKPFCLWLASTDPHRPYKPWDNEYRHDPKQVAVPAYLPDVPITRMELAQYYDAISRLDHDMGEVLDELDRAKLTDNTLVLFISDNGQPFPRAKTTLYDSGIHTPLVIRWPQQVRAGRTCHSLVSSIDIAPTIVELAGLPRPKSFQGVSLVPLFSIPDEEVRKYIFAEHNWHDYTAYDRCVRTERFKYIRNGYLDLPATPPADAVSGTTFQNMRRLHDDGRLIPMFMTSFAVPRPAEELYRVADDSDEMHNVVDDPAYRNELAALRKILDQWQQVTRDRMPLQRTPDGFDRNTGDRLGKPGPRVASPELRAEAVD
jgi:N-sulfoglucosamine sulfohydrolase